MQVTSCSGKKNPRHLRQFDSDTHSIPAAEDPIYLAVSDDTASSLNSHMNSDFDQQSSINEPNNASYADIDTDMSQVTTSDDDAVQVIASTAIAVPVAAPPPPSPLSPPHRYSHT